MLVLFQSHPLIADAYSFVHLQEKIHIFGTVEV